MTYNKAKYILRNLLYDCQTAVFIALRILLLGTLLSGAKTFIWVLITNIGYIIIAINITPDEAYNLTVPYIAGCFIIIYVYTLLAQRLIMHIKRRNGNDD